MLTKFACLTSLLAVTAVLAGCGSSPTGLGVAAAGAAPPALAASASSATGAAPMPDLAVRQSVAASAADVSAQAVTLDLLTYNTWGKPGLLGTDLKKRFSRMGAQITPFAVVAMQESFSTYARNMGKTSGFPHMHYQNNWDLLNINSGLMTLSKYPIVKTDFQKFKQAKDADAFANKGVLLTRLNVAGIGEVDIYNTHYQSKEARSGIRMHDNEVLEAIVKRNDKGNPTFLMGDFNMQPGTPEYLDLMKRLSPRDTWAELYPQDPGYTASPENPRRGADSKPKRIDYIFALPNARFHVRAESLRVMFKEPVDGHVLSDHYGLSGRFSITPRTP